MSAGARRTLSFDRAMNLNGRCETCARRSCACPFGRSRDRTQAFGRSSRFGVAGRTTEGESGGVRSARAASPREPLLRYRRSQARRARRVAARAGGGWRLHPDPEDPGARPGRAYRTRRMGGPGRRAGAEARADHRSRRARAARSRPAGGAGSRVHHRGGAAADARGAAGPGCAARPHRGRLRRRCYRLCRIRQWHAATRAARRGRARAEGRAGARSLFAAADLAPVGALDHHRRRQILSRLSAGRRQAAVRRAGDTRRRSTRQ
jgi:hypothetical protein